MGELKLAGGKQKTKVEKTNWVVETRTVRK